MSKKNRTKVEELLRDEILKIEQNINSFKKDIEIIKYLASSVEGVATTLGYGVEELEISVKNIKALLNLDTEVD
jgi:hypothetical protein